MVHVHEKQCSRRLTDKLIPCLYYAGVLFSILVIVLWPALGSESLVIGLNELISFIPRYSLEVVDATE